MPDAAPRWMTHAAVMLDLHQPDRALAALTRFGDDAPPQAVMLRVRALVATGARDEALQIVEARAARDEANRARWAEVLARLRALPAR